jgi:2-dehydro-3-deoxy-D-arabinonate dehydratase
MRLGQVKVEGRLIAAVWEGDLARPIPSHTTLDLIRRAETENRPLAVLAAELASRHAEKLAPCLPVLPPEVWACGCTYETTSTFRDAEQGTHEGMYTRVYRDARPEIFFKGTTRVCVASGQSIGIRSDSRFTAPEPELAIVLGCRGRIAGYTLANDVSAWDIERDNPLYLTQSKVYDSCCALGPVFVTADALADPYSLEISCSIERAGQLVFEAAVSTAKLHRRLDVLVTALTFANRVPVGSVLLTGTGIIVPPEAALAPGDIVRIRIPEIGELVNTAAVVG